jgi:hypothetical protein
MELFMVLKPLDTPLNATELRRYRAACESGPEIATFLPAQIDDYPDGVPGGRRRYILDTAETLREAYEEHRLGTRAGVNVFGSKADPKVAAEKMSAELAAELGPHAGREVADRVIALVDTAIAVAHDSGRP